jgi:hypothetical protein
VQPRRHRCTEKNQKSRTSGRSLNDELGAIGNHFRPLPQPNPHGRLASDMIGFRQLTSNEPLTGSAL